MIVFNVQMIIALDELIVYENISARHYHEMIMYPIMSYYL